VESKPKVLFLAIDDMNNGITLFGKDRPFRGPNLEKLGKRREFFSEVYCSSNSVTLHGYPC
jgi:hypothetical protein